jgi:type IV pilus assembly protein PilC
MPTFNVKIQKADGSTEDLIVESKSPLNAKNFLRRRGLKPIEVQISKSNTSSRTETRERDYIATCELKNGTRTTVEIAAISEIAARRELRRRGKRVLKLEPARKQNNSTKIAEKTITTSILSEPKTKTVIAQKKGSALQSIEQLFERPPGVKEKAIWASKLSALVDAGVPIVRGLDLMATQQKLPLFQRALSELSAEVNQGVAMGTAMRANSKVFDQLTIAMVEAGEAGGVLDEALKRLAKLLEDNAKLQNQIKGALGYPVAVLVIAILVFLGMTIFLIPTFAGIFEDLGAELPAFTQLLVDLSELLRSPVALYAAGAILLSIWLFGRFYATHNGRRTIDRLVLKLPLFGELILMTATAQFCRIFSSLTRAGVPILMSMEISSETAGNSIISDAILASRGMVQEGVLLSNALIRHKVLPDMALNMLAIGEETGEMDKMLSKVADFYEDEVGAMVKALTSMLEPAMIVVVGGIVGSILLAMYLPMFTVFDQIQ